MFFNNSTNNHKETEILPDIFCDQGLIVNTRHHNSSECSRLVYKPSTALEFNFYKLLVRYVAVTPEMIFIFLPKFKNAPPYAVLVCLPRSPNKEGHLHMHLHSRWCSLQRTNSKCCGIGKPNPVTHENPVHRTTAGSLSES